VVLRALRIAGLGIGIGIGALTMAEAAASQTAEEDPVEAARRQFRRGLSLEAAADWSGALAAFEAVAAVRLTPQVQYHLGVCKERLGRTSEALGDYRLAEHEASRIEGFPSEDLDAIRAARQELEAQVPRLIIQLGSETSSVDVLLDGVAVGRSRIGQPLSVDPGTHSVVGVLPGGGRFEEIVDLEVGQTQTIVLDIPDELRTAPPTPPGPPEAAPTPIPDSAEGHRAPAPAERRRSPVPWIVGGIGVASLGTSGVFYALMQRPKRELEDQCREGVCPDSSEAQWDRGRLYANLTSGTLIAGAATVGVATIWLAARGKEREGASRLAPQLIASPPYVGVRGRF
jgi:hypothetical protein